MAPEAISLVVSRKRIQKIIQLTLLYLALVSREGRELESEVVITDMLRERIHEQMAEMEYNES
jgi:hypothetical protein